MATTKIGAMRIDITASTAQFMSATEAMRGKLSSIGKDFEKVGARISSIGAGMTKYLTAPIAAVGGALTASAMSMASSVQEIQKSAQLAGTSFEDFQRLAYAAKSVGFEGDKVADIFKDVNDKFGEFAQTGGGELKDFFTNIAPKVGVTAEAFRKLSGPDSLQLYYDTLKKAGVSQRDMTFYMEALANDATALIPLLADGGKGFAELGKQAAVLDGADAKGLQRFTEASRQMGEAWKKLTIAFVDSGLLDVVTNLITKFAQWTGEFAKINPETAKWVTIIGGAIAVLGPVVAGIGGLVTGFGALLPLLAPVVIALAPIAGPLALIAAGATAVYIAWKKWPEIVGFAKDLYEGVKTWLADKLNAIWDRVMQPIRAVKKAFYDLYDSVVGHSYIPDLVDGIRDQFARLDTVMVIPAAQAIGRVDTAFDTGALSISEAWDGMARNVLDSTGRLVQGIKSGGLLNILGGVLDIATTLGGLGVFGSKVKANISDQVPGISGFRAFGGPVTAGRSYVVGERGPELFTASRSGYIHPNADGGGGGLRVQVVKGDLFDVIVDRRAAAVAAPMAAQAAAAGSAGAVKYFNRRATRRLV